MLAGVIQLHAAGQLDAAEQGYRSLIEQCPDAELAFANLAIICLTSGRTDEAMDLLRSAIRINPANPETHLNLGIAFKEKGDVATALTYYHKALEINPVYPEAYNNLGVAHVEQGHLEEAMDFYQMALELKENFTEAQYNLGNVYNALGKPQEAIDCYRKLLELRPEYGNAYLNLSNVLTGLGRLDESRDILLQALSIKPNFPEAYLNLSGVFLAQGKTADAVDILRKAVELNPHSSDIYNNLGIALRDHRQFDEAVASYRQAIELNPHFSNAYNNLGSLLLVQNRVDEALSVYHQGLQIITAGLPATSPVRRLSALLIDLERIPLVYRDAAELVDCRKRYTERLSEASSLVADQQGAFSTEERTVIRQILFRITNFNVGYQQLNDKDLQIAYSQLATKLLSPEIDEYLTLDRVPHSESKIRLGIATELLNRHSATYWDYGWLANLPQEDYQIFAYSLQGKSDETTDKFAALGTYRWLPFRHDSYLHSLKVIRDDNLDVLLIPDVGMTASGRILSLTRLAPIQCMAFTHPITSGSSNIDYYLSSELMGTADSDSYYSEQLLRLPNLGAHLDCPVVEARILSRSDFGLPEGRTLYGSVQSLFKYLPQYDFVFPSIAKAVPSAIFAFIANESDRVTAVFEERLKNVFEKAGLNYVDYVKILPRMPLGSFHQLLRLLDANIDTIGWNGSTTTLSSLVADCPVVTLPGMFMRGRHCYSILKVIDADELIAGSIDEYISLAGKIGLDREFRSRMVEKIQANRHRLFNDKECIANLDRLLKSKVQELRESGQGNQNRVLIADVSSLEPNDQAYVHSGLICLMDGRPAESVEHFQAALAINPDNFDTHLKLGLAFSHLGDSAGALSSWRKALELNPNFPEAYINMGVAFCEQGNLDEAIACYYKALAIRPDYAEVHYNLGNVFLAQGRKDEAISSYRKAIELKSDYAEAYLCLGNAFSGDVEAARACYQKALEINPDYPEAYQNLGNALTALGKLDESVELYQKALQLRPQYYQVYNNLGVTQREQGKVADAIEAFSKAIEINSDYPEAHLNLGLAFNDQGHPAEAIKSYQRALELRPNYPEAYSYIGAALGVQGNPEGATDYEYKAVEVRTANLPAQSLCGKLARLLIELKRIPVVYKEVADIKKCRDHYTSCLHEALAIMANKENVFTDEETGILREIVFGITNFYLGYQSLNDKELQIAYSKLATDILRPEIKPYLALDRLVPSGAKIRLGLASQYLKHHNGSNFAYNWLNNLPKDNYEFFLYSLNGKTDDLTEKFAALGTYRWLPFNQSNYLNSLNVIKQDNLDILFLPDVGMTAASRIISLVRLAPIQCVAWGHPITTGSSTIDYFLTNGLMETEQADSHYSEKLIRVPNQHYHCQIPPVLNESVSSADFGVPADRVVYGSVQSMFKYLPQYDLVFPSIAKLVPNAFFLFIGGDSDFITNIFEERIKNSFSQYGLNSADYVRILRRMPHSRFVELLSVLDVNLDSIGWTGGNSTTYSLAMGCPVVTFPGESLRARHSYAILKAIGLDELIVSSLDEYVSLAAGLGLDNKLRMSVIEKIKAQNHKLFDHRECGEFLDGFFKSKVKEVRSSVPL